MIARALKYSFANAKTRALKSKTLSPGDWQALLTGASLEDILRVLRGTPYREVLSRLPAGRPQADQITLALYDELFIDYAKLLKAVPHGGAVIIKALLARYEAENLKTILRGVWGKRPASETRYLLFHLGRLTAVPTAALLAAANVDDAIPLLKRSPYYRHLTHALPQFKARGNLFPLEIAVDSAVFEGLSQAVRSLGRRDRKGSETLIGELIDFENISWLARFRYNYGLTPEEVINYTLPGGKNLSIRDLGSLARTQDLSSFIESLPKPYSEALRVAKDWPDIQPRFERWFLGRLLRNLRGDPFQISIQVSFLLLKEIEIRALDGLISFVDFGGLPEQAPDLARLPLWGGVDV